MAKKKVKKFVRCNVTTMLNIKNEAYYEVLFVLKSDQYKSGSAVSIVDETGMGYFYDIAYFE